MMPVGFDLGNVMSKVCQLNPKVLECARLAHCLLLVVGETTSVYLLHSPIFTTHHRSEHRLKRANTIRDLFPSGLLHKVVRKGFLMPCSSKVSLGPERNYASDIVLWMFSEFR